MITIYEVRGTVGGVYQRKWCFSRKEAEDANWGRVYKHRTMKNKEQLIEWLNENCTFIDKEKSCEP